MVKEFKVDRYYRALVTDDYRIKDKIYLAEEKTTRKALYFMTEKGSVNFTVLNEKWEEVNKQQDYQIF